ncbi:MAG: OsmC family protein [Hyphomicrobiales bacterium]
MTEPRGLADYLRQKGEAMKRAAAARPTADEWREEVQATVVADDLTGVRKLHIRDWQLISDSGPAFGGWGLGPSSPELLCGVLATCLTHTYEIGAATMGVPIDRIEVRVTANNNDAGLLGIESSDPALPWGITARVSVESAAPAARVDELHAWAKAHCPLTNLVRTPNDVRIEVVR